MHKMRQISVKGYKKLGKFGTFGEPDGSPGEPILGLGEPDHRLKGSAGQLVLYETVSGGLRLLPCILFSTRIFSLLL